MYMYMCNVYCMIIFLFILELVVGFDVYWIEILFFFVDIECLIFFIICLFYYVNMY